MGPFFKHTLKVLEKHLGKGTNGNLLATTILSNTEVKAKPPPSSCHALPKENTRGHSWADAEYHTAVCNAIQSAGQSNCFSQRHRP